jgi:hypothetical protein
MYLDHSRFSYGMPSPFNSSFAAVFGSIDEEEGQALSTLEFRACLGLTPRPMSDLPTGKCYANAINFSSRILPRALLSQAKRRYCRRPKSKESREGAAEAQSLLVFMTDDGRRLSNKDDSVGEESERRLFAGLATSPRAAPVSPPVAPSAWTWRDCSGV